MSSKRSTAYRRERFRGRPASFNESHPIPASVRNRLNTTFAVVFTENSRKLSSHIEIVPGVCLYPAFVSEAEPMFVALEAELELRQEYLNFGRGRVAMPRLTGWYGDPGASYRYSGLVNVPAPWTPALAALRADLSVRLAADLNSCLVNFYRNGEDSMGWHADDERELRDRIVSVSLGASRTFRLREGRRGKSIAIELTAGSVLTMTVESQSRWQHAVPKRAGGGSRLNLTFRSVVPNQFTSS